MASPYEMFSTDKEMEKDGVWMKFPGFELKVARFSDSNPSLMAAHRRRLKKHGISADEEVDFETDREIGNEIIAEAILTGWRSTDEKGNTVDTIPGSDGKPMVCNFKTKMQLLTDLPELKARIVRFARDHANYQVKVLEEAVGN